MHYYLDFDNTRATLESRKLSSQLEIRKFTKSFEISSNNFNCNSIALPESNDSKVCEN